MIKRRHKDYYEAILQLRNPSDAATSIIKEEVEANPDVFISKTKKVVNGIDYYLSSNAFAKSLGRLLQERIGGELKLSKKLFSQHRLTSRLLYRGTVLFRLAPFSVGDIIIVNMKAFRVTGIGKRRIYCTDIENGRSTELDYAKAAREFNHPQVTRAVISKTSPWLEIIHPDTFQSVPVLPQVKHSKLKTGSRIKVAFHESKVWLWQIS